MKRSRLSIFFYYTLLVCFLMPVAGFAQIGEVGCDPFDPGCPIDGGLSLLIAAGIGLGAKKAYDRKKKVDAAREQ